MELAGHGPAGAAIAASDVMGLAHDGLLDLPMARATLEATWLRLTRETLPALAAARDWPVRADHCFQRILLDHAFGGCWYAHVTGRPAYKSIDNADLTRAIAMAEAIVAGDADVTGLNRQSLSWRAR